ncbi:OB-fold nucleic acid binding domain-containing protein [Salinibacterium sp. ZJ454]|uniref:Zn-ribbon domain-containing OB-fold protein n=1 Tax=Salinibacterium sp. ZJ454 TaxID=2708339 RepID=UPI0014203701|nr:OB-fold nucleic acid binding domain-containing protein [Salinibacterium sp. ZJ454]
MTTITRIGEEPPEAMAAQISTRIGEGLPEAMAAQISMPYTLTPGRATGIFLAELANRRLIGSRYPDNSIIVPAQDFSGSTGEEATGFVEVAPSGVLRGFTTTELGTIGLVLINGSDVPMVHRILVDDPGSLTVGDRVEIVWSEEPTGGMLDITGFAPTEARDTDTGGSGFEPRDAGTLADPLERIEYRMTLDYQHSYGPYYGTLFDGVKSDRRIRGVRCSRCRRVLLPPRAQCDECFAPTHEWVDIEPVGTIQACSVVYIEFIGQRLAPPYIYAEIVLDGTSTRLIHMISGDAANADMHAVEPGDRVRAVWGEGRTGSLADIEYFEMLPGGSE